MVTSTEHGSRRSSTETTGWVGWIAFAGAILILSGIFQIIQGLVALFNDGFYVVQPSGLVIDVDYNTWGWTHLITGGLVIAIGLGLFSGNIVARVMGVIIASLSAIVNLAFIEAAPVWSTLVIAMDVIVIYSIMVHGREMKNASY